GSNHPPTFPSPTIGRHHQRQQILSSTRHTTTLLKAGASITQNLNYNRYIKETYTGDPLNMGPDPIRFSIQCDRQQINIDEEVNLTITAQLLNVAPGELFFLPGANAYTLKLILPPGFEQTGGDFVDYVVGHLYASQPVKAYRLKGRFRSVTPGSSFRLLRSHGQANDQSLFAEKSVVTLQTVSAETTVSQLRKAARRSTNPAEVTLYVITESTAPGAARTAAGSYRGYLDYAACDEVSGWVMDMNNLRQSPQVDIYINGVKVASLQTEQARQDVANAFGVKDYNKYGFVWVIPENYKANAPLTLSVRPTETSQDLSGSPRKTAICPGIGSAPTSTTTTAPTTTPATTPTAPTSTTTAPATTAPVTATTTVTTPPATTTPTTTDPAPASSGACASSISAISYGWDGGNSSISIGINSSVSDPQIKLSGPSLVDWVRTYNAGGGNWFWAQTGMNQGTYTLSVRPAGDGGAGCSFTFSVPGAGKQVYAVATTNNPPSTSPAPACSPPPAPTLSTSGGTQICNNSTLMLTAAGCSGTVTWSGGQTGSSLSVNAAGSYSATCTVNGCVSAPSAQVTVTACTNTTGTRYNRVLFVGNSITVHGGSQFFITNAQNPKRGMAATSPDKDYFHLMSAKLKTLNPNVDNRMFATWDMGGQLDDATGPFWEGQSTINGIDLSRFDPVASWKPDLVYIRLGENVADEQITDQSLYQSRLKALIDKLISQSPGAKVVLSTSVWDKPNYDKAIRAVAAERSYPLADFSNMWPNRLINSYYALNPSIYGDAATDKHPDDDGMAHIADVLWDVTPK
ncbi:MAG: hydrolase family protein, partial [Spirosoma sp.]|nr:hydrolase family protein [Spirosoma sp.]